MGILRSLERADLGAMVQVVQRSLLHHSITDSILLEKTFGAFDYAPELNIGYFEGERLAGFACGCLFAQRGRAGIRMTLVDPRDRERGIGSKLLLELEERLAGTGPVSFIQAAATPGNYLTPGIDPSEMATTCFLEKCGYTVVDVAQNLTAQTSAQRDYRDVLERLLNAEYEVRRAQPSDQEQLLEFVISNFPQWQQEVRRALLNNPATVHICTTDSTIAGFACSESNNIGTGILGPAGIHPAHRGKGIGTVTLHRCVDDLRSLGFEKFSLQWLRFDLNRFARHEFGPCSRYTYWIYRKNHKT